MATPRTNSPRPYPAAEHFTASDAEGLAALATPSIRRRIEACVDTSAGPDACSPWTGGRYQTGQGRFFLAVAGQRRDEVASRLVWALYRGVIPDGYVIRHSCPNAWCVNLAHLFPALPVDSTRTTIALGQHHEATKTTCPAGHSLTDPENVVLDEGSRRCRECRTARLATSRLAHPDRWARYGQTLWARTVADPARHERKKADLRDWRARHRDRINAQNRARYRRTQEITAAS